MRAQGYQSQQDVPPLNIYKKQWITGYLKHFFCGVKLRLSGTNHVVTSLHSILSNTVRQLTYYYRVSHLGSEPIAPCKRNTHRNRGVMSKNPPGAYISLITPVSLKWHWHIRGIGGKHCSSTAWCMPYTVWHEGPALAPKWAQKPSCT